MKNKQQKDLIEIPMDVKTLIDENHIVRLVWEVIDQMELENLYKSYKKVGGTAYHPKAMLSIIVYGITQGIYSYRNLENACKENICFMWISDFAMPDHSTIHRFHQRLLKTNDELAKEIVTSLLKRNLIDLSILSIDGTKIESVANKYTNVYKGTVGYHESNMDQVINEAIKEKYEEENKNDNEDKPNTPNSPSKNLNEKEESKLEIPENIKKILSIDNTNKRLKNSKNKNRKYVSNLSIEDMLEIIKWLITLSDTQLKENPNILKLYKNMDRYFIRKLKYIDQREKLGKRNSYSKTDEEASFMKLKDDSFDTKVLSPAYNLQGTSCNGFMVGAFISNSAADTRLLPDVMRKLKEIGALTKKSIILADAGYGSMENYEYLKKENQENIIPYMTYRHENKRKYKNNPCTIDKFDMYSIEEIICPNGRSLYYEKTYTNTSINGFESYKHIYRAADCSGCAMADHCLKKNQTTKSLTIDLEWLKWKEEIKEKIVQEENREKFKKRFEIEQNFSTLKHNNKLKRFRHYGIKMNMLVTLTYMLGINIKREYNQKLLLMCSKIKKLILIIKIAPV